MTTPLDIPAQPPSKLPTGEPFQCPNCGGIFERPINVDGKTLRGHTVGDPRVCPKMAGATVRDARERKAARRAQ